MEQIIKYIEKEYKPLSVIVYGSYANGTNNLNSDFDALVISSEQELFHNTSFINGVQLDVFVYPASYFDGEYDCNQFIQIFDGRIILDSNNIGKNLIIKVQDYLKNRPYKTKDEIQADIDWCKKMFERVKRCDAEGMFRWHWLLIDSLEIFCDMKQQAYFGPKKSLKWMKENYPVAFEYYNNALQNFNIDSLEKWVVYIKETFETE